MSYQRENQTNRILSIFERLCKGHVLTKHSEAALFNVNEKTIQRDFDNIRNYLDLARTNAFFVYDRSLKGYRLETGHEPYLKKEEILAIVKILIESRAFPKSEMNDLIDKLTNLVHPVNKEVIKKIMSNEKHLYVDLQHEQSLFLSLWELTQAIHTKKLINIHYKREFDGVNNVRQLKPVGLIFSDYYFYLIAFQLNHKHNFPTIYRVDRITELKVTEEHFDFPYKNRFQEGEFRKRIQFMYAGELMTIQFRFTGPSPQAVLDRLPTARILSRTDYELVFEAEVFGTGIKMWLLSQGEYVEVLKPEELRNDMKNSVMAMLEKYS